MFQRIAYQVRGTVQGVNFRASTVKQANQLSLTGFVQNDPDGSVSGEAQGDATHIKEFTKYLHQGPTHAKVDKVEHKDIATKTGESGFGVH